LDIEKTDDLLIINVEIVCKIAEIGKGGEGKGGKGKEKKGREG
jgi:hypothetical protein